MAMEQPDHAQLPVPPPLAYLVAAVLGVGLDLALPLPVAPMAVGVVAGAALIVLAAALLGWAARTMVAAGEHPDPQRPTTAIVTTGPYRVTRNPIYVAMALFTVGVALLVNSGWGLALVVPALIATHYLAIAREERYLEGKLGDEYRSYRGRVRRWI